MTSFINAVSNLAAVKAFEITPENEGGWGLALFVFIVLVSIGSWLLAEKFRDDYGTQEMSRIKGIALIFGLTVVTVGMVMMIESVTSNASRAPIEPMKVAALTIVAGTALCVLSCIGILSRYTGFAAVGMIFRLYIVGLAICLLVSWIIMGILMWIGLQLFRFFTRRRYVVVEVD